MKTIDEALARTGREIREAADARRLPSRRTPPRRVAARAVAVAAVLALAIVVPAVWLQSDGPVASSPTAADDFGVWTAMAEAPMPPRPHAVSVWTGSEAVFWAGSSLDRGFAYTDGAAYDPSTDAWRAIPVPGWGHPGLAGAFFDGRIYALAKGGGSSFDPSSGAWVDLPPVEGMLMSATVATDDAVWGMGPGLVNAGGQTDVHIARYDPAANSWVYGPVFEGTDETGSLFEDLFFIDQPAIWTGAEIVLWNPDGGGIAFDPATEEWRSLSLEAPTGGVVSASAATATSNGLVVVAEVVSDGEATLWFARPLGGRWEWTDLGVSVDDFAAVTLAAAADWVVVFAPDHAPITIDVPAGGWTEHTDGLLGGVEAPNTVWTGRQLVVWGGVATDPSSPSGAVWTP